ncbi:tetraspanin-2-like [Archocentrus centrarchus]|uniref:tetraspanin-2-like n=1 Tax=Archocentrus centrarchus TaxID=63155 RepID=UPI0011EA4DAA|nr:tetraspanin-2-like [Archocentrus centrarchus]
MSKVQGGMKCVKYLLFAFNIIFWVSGLLVLAVGLWLRFDPNTVDLLTGDGAPYTFFIAVYILLGAGALMMVVGFLGCFGAMRESQCLLALFFACLVIIFGAEVTAGVFGFLNKQQISEEVQKFYSSAIVDSNPNGTAIAIIYHKALNCCGAPTLDPKSELCVDLPDDTQDCLTAITDFFDEKLYIIGYIGIGIAGVMIIGMIFSMVLCCAIRNSREVI